MSVDDDRERLSQKRMLERLRRDISMNEMIPVYLSDRGEQYNHGIYCALIPSSEIERVLCHPAWDLSHGKGLPESEERYKDDEKRIEYLRFGTSNGVEPLVIDRDFFGLRDNYTEISEEFRLFHRLYHDRKLDHFIKIDDDGNEELVAIVEANRVQIRLKEILQFLAIKEMHLSIQFDCLEHSKHSLEELGLEDGGIDQCDGLVRWGHYCKDSSDIGKHQAFSRLLGKRLLAPVSKSKSGFYDFAEETPKKYVDFIIGIDENGDEVSHTSDPDTLANFFGANPSAPHYLTPVHFRKQVLDKYYQQPSKYSVKDGVLRCGNLWCMYIDNHHDEKVCAWLGDLGRDLSYEEQLHWRAHNITSQEGISETHFTRQILAEFTNSDRLEHSFPQRYQELAIACEEKLGWRLLLPLDKRDEHYFKCIRIPATDEQSDFDELVLGLTKILIDSLNEGQLNVLIPEDQRKSLSGISRLEAALTACRVVDANEHIAFLRQLQNLRSTGSAHRKGKEYQKIAKCFGLESQNLRAVITEILQMSIALLDYLTRAVNNGALSPNLANRGSGNKV
ncbi:hypothetical protein [Methanothrix soehngenii]|jgi:hypothetical protein|uniref:hypothetical protein n=1 Tax=Methanothrix soehngenii TaxID=2223 RepID=UPI0009D567E6|nr:MAG: hypothetical protein A4E49_00376 [Methanosaeta sp. PtaU1.Bin112]HOE45112.1 hypothetical protein [Methanothrix soehngenii]HOS21517.1 hypothetical protein [Methanothrix soehngenii]HPL19989.1 hypothetical protein [Methanothrix soehngenii]